MIVDPARLKTIVFDVDGTLYRQGGMRRAMLLRLLVGLATSPMTGIATFRALRAYRHAQEALRDHAIEEALAEAQLRVACEQTGLARDVVEPIVARWMHREPLPLLSRFVDPALPGFLVAARARGMRLGVLSDYPAHDKLEAMGLREHFDVVVSAQDADVNRFKPRPDGIFAALRRLEVAPEHALYVGDRPDVDAPAARAAGVPCVIIGRRAAKSARARAGASSDWTGVGDYRELHATLFPQTRG